MADWAALLLAAIALMQTVATLAVAYIALKQRQLDAIARDARETRHLCNSAMGAQKRLLATTARAKANITNHPVDVLAAEQAERDLREHDARQDLADRYIEARDAK
jgi:hypothetical protein